jgi:hypothetical protein
MLGIRKAIYVHNEVSTVVNGGYVEVGHAKISEVIGVYAITDINHDSTNYVDYQAMVTDEDKTKYSRAKGIIYQPDGTNDQYFIKRYNVEFTREGRWIKLRADHGLSDATEVLIEYVAGQYQHATAVTDDGEVMTRESAVVGYVYTRGADKSLFDGYNLGEDLGDLVERDPSAALAVNYIPLYQSTFGHGDLRTFKGNSFKLDRVVIIYNMNAAITLDYVYFLGARALAATTTEYVRQLGSFVFRALAVPEFTVVTAADAAFGTDENNVDSHVVLQEAGKLYLALDFSGTTFNENTADWIEIRVYGRASG